MMAERSTDIPMDMTKEIVTIHNFSNASKEGLEEISVKYHNFLAGPEGLTYLIIHFFTI
jgi:hypothetical protein